LINQIIFEDACKSCKRRGLAHICDHKKGERPWWQDPKREKDIQLMTQDNQESYLRETKGIITDANSQAVFDVTKIEEFFNSSFKIDFDAKHVFVGYDPAAGGKRSDTAIVSIIPISNTHRGVKTVVSVKPFFFFIF
jgi:hypothetical protein